MHTDRQTHHRTSSSQYSRPTPCLGGVKQSDKRTDRQTDTRPMLYAYCDGRGQRKRRCGPRYVGPYVQSDADDRWFKTRTIGLLSVSVIAEAEKLISSLSLSLSLVGSVNLPAGTERSDSCRCHR